MSDNYLPMIQDFFQVFEALNQHVLDSYGELATWETQLVRLDINQGDKEKSYDVAQIASMLNVSEDAVKSFLVIYSFLSNNLYDLIGNREYEDWGTDGDSLQVEYSDLTIESFDADQIAPLMERRVYFEWTFDALQRSYDEMMAIKHGRIA
ncbi:MULTISPECIES: hypothetical protein [Vibrio]|uniref:hypothetical protein n=1 Tax=Vibrio TaxID=662 RepID=UPI000237565C|nr:MULTISPECIES: hypothetical protein [Vibrio]MDK9778800.1 hypothetical protein [Vibrio sp. D401a]MDK9804163.1 hypothetical protein [Vibrio sp. D406a]NOH66653.1 hypothetical protein [Vibrio rotiferianus]TMX63318.1 hypothetical protein DA097_13895 [Vibrio rotiferianus]USD52974.1 hypothetical protein J4N37_19165 [Vibrio sp. SCSIO 43153]